MFLTSGSGVLAWHTKDAGNGDESDHRTMISRPHPDISRTRQHFRRFAPVLVAGISLFAWSCSEDTPSSPEAPQLTPPAPTSVVEVTSPPRGGMVQDGTLDVSPISLSGSAYDSVSTVTSLTIGGQSVSLSGTPPCLDFTTQMDSRWGLNIITGSARNEAGTTMTLAQSY